MLEKQLKIANEKQPGITPFRSQSYLLQRKINQVQLKLLEEIYKIKQIEVRLKEIENDLSEFRKILSEFIELMQSQLAWIGTNSFFPDNMPQNTIGELKMELELLDFSSRATERLNTAVEKTIEKCNVFYKKMCMTHNKCQASTTTQF